MPLFEYRCKQCGHVTEFLEKADTKAVRWRQFRGQSGCFRLLGKGTFPGGSEYRCLFSAVPVGMGTSPAVNPGDLAGQGAA
jgi:hypothetical protein